MTQIFAAGAGRPTAFQGIGRPIIRRRARRIAPAGSTRVAVSSSRSDGTTQSACLVEPVSRLAHRDPLQDHERPAAGAPAPAAAPLADKLERQFRRQQAKGV